MIQVKEAIIVEGRYDCNTLRQIVDAVIIETGGFRIFNDKQRLEMIRKIADKRGILILTDSDGAGFVIRNFLKGAIPQEQIKHAYIPDIFGKEHRKRQASKEGKLGVEGMRPEIIKQALLRAGATIFEGSREQSTNNKKLTKADLFTFGLTGGSGSCKRRHALLQRLQLPEHMSTNALLEFINAISDIEAVKKIIAEIEESN